MTLTGPVVRHITPTTRWHGLESVAGLLGLGLRSGAKNNNVDLVESRLCKQFQRRRPYVGIKVLAGFCVVTIRDDTRAVLPTCVVAPE